MKIQVSLSGRDNIELDLELKEGLISSARLKAVGCHELLKKVSELRPKLKGRLEDISLPEGDDHSSILLREILLKAQANWNFPYKDAELCHCRAVPTTKVDEAVVAGCHRVEEVGDMTSAGTACGSCRPDTQRIIAFRLNRKAS